MPTFPLIDPSNPLLLPNLVQTETMVHVQGPASLPWEVSDGPHGVVHHHFYKSGINQRKRFLQIFLSLQRPEGNALTVQFKVLLRRSTSDVAEDYQAE
jgi:hypothetical protein